MEDIAYHESFVRNRMESAFKEDNNKMEDCQGHQRTGWDDVVKSSQLGLLIDPKSDPSVSKVVQQNYVGLQLYREGKFYSSRLE